MSNDATIDAKALAGYLGGLATLFRAWPSEAMWGASGQAEHAAGLLDQAQTLLAALREPAPTIEEGSTVADMARFLLARIADLDWCGDFPEDFLRDWHGHVDPALSRLEGALSDSPLPVLNPRRLGVDSDGGVVR